VDLLSSDLALRCGDRGEAEASERATVGASLVKSCGREQPPISTAWSSLDRCRVSQPGGRPSLLVQEGALLPLRGSTLSRTT
jgi:hypothetical protein